MDNVKIGEGVVIQGAIICTNSKLSQKSEFKDCLVGYDQDVVSTGNFSRNFYFHSLTSAIARYKPHSTVRFE